MREVNIMAKMKTACAGPSGVLRMTWMTDNLAHVLAHSDADEPTGTWTGLACPHHRLALGADLDAAALQCLCEHGEIADIIWEAPDDFAAEHGHVFEAAMLAHRAGNAKRAEMLWQEVEAICSRAWAANYASLDLLQRSGLNRFAQIKPQRWVVASFEHHCGPHGLQHPHIHNVVVADLTAGRHQEVRGGGR
jgi:hypothetical protein